MKIPSTKTQIPNKFQNSINNFSNKITREATRGRGPGYLEFGILFFGIYLDFGAWNLEFIFNSCTCPHQLPL